MTISSEKTITQNLVIINEQSTSEAKQLLVKRPHHSIAVLTIQLIFNPIREFVQKYFIWKMYKEGTHGAAASILYAFYHFLIVAKYLQLTLENEK